MPVRLERLRSASCEVSEDLTALFNAAVTVIFDALGHLTKRSLFITNQCWIIDGDLALELCIFWLLIDGKLLKLLLQELESQLWQDVFGEVEVLAVPRVRVKPVFLVHNLEQRVEHLIELQKEFGA